MDSLACQQVPGLGGFGASPHVQLTTVLGPGFHSVFTHAVIGMVLADLDGHCLAANSAICDMLSRTEPELLGRTFHAFTHPDDLAANLECGKSLIAGDIPSFKLEKRYLDRAGRTLWVLLSACLLLGADGKPLCVISQIQDISERKRMEDALRASEERYRRLVETSPDAVVMTGLDGTILFCNQSSATLHGYERIEDMVGKSAFSLIAPEDHIRANTNLQMTLQTGVVRSIEYTLLRKDGGRFPAELNATVVRGENGAPEAFIGVVRDITQRKRANEALQESEERYRRLVESSPDLIAVAKSGKIDFMNAAGLRLIGARTVEQVSDMPVLDLIHPGSRSEVGASLAALQQGEVQFSAREQRWLRLDGTPIDVEMAAVLLTYQGGQAVQIVGHDITDRKHAEIAEREQRLLAEALSDAAGILNSTLDFDQVLDRLLLNAGRVVPHDAANILMVDPERQEAYVARAQGYAERELEQWVKHLRFPLSAMPILQEMMSTGRPRIIPDVQDEPRWYSVPESRWMRSYAAAPIRIKGQTVGFLNFDSAAPGFFTPSQLSRLQAFADQAAIAIENARLFEATRHSVEHLTMLHESGVHLAKAETVDALYREVLLWARSLGAAAIATLAVYDGVNHLVIVAASGIPDEVVGSRIALGEGLNGLVARTRQPTHMSHYDDWEGRLATFSALGVVSAVGIPLIWQDRLVGTLAIADRCERDFDADDMHVLNLFGSLVAAALEQRRAVADARAREAEANALSTRLSHAQEEERVRIAEQLHDSVGYRLVSLQKNTEAALQALGGDHPLALHLANNLKVLQETHQLVRSLAMDLNSKILADLGISPAARQYVDRLATSTGMAIGLHVTGRVRRLPADIERVAFRSMQETLVNAIRHARATEISAQLHFSGKSLRLTVQDNGCGFDPACLETNARGTALGLPELRRQVDVLRGDLQVESALGLGTIVVVTLPFQVALLPEKAKTRVLLVDDHESTRQGLRLQLAQSGEFTCAGESADGLSAIHQVELNHPELVIMDIALPGLNGIEAARQITKRFPHVGILMFSYHEDEAYLQQAFQAGARGYVVKTDDSREVIRALQAVHAGELYVSRKLAETWERLKVQPPASDPLQTLTTREREVFQMIVSGSTSRCVGERLGISVRTVEVHRKNIMSKLGVRNLTQLVKFAA